MRRWFTVLALLYAGCGRLSFDPARGDGGAGGDGATGDGPAGCAGPATLFCDGFEDPALGAWSSSNGDVQHITTGSHTGTGALRATADGAAGDASTSADLTPIAAGGLHARGWFYLPSGYPIQKFNMLELRGDASGAIALVDQGELNGYIASPPAHTLYSGITLPRDQWFCVVLDLVVGYTTTNGTMSLSLDGTQVGGMASINTMASGGSYRSISAGMPYVDPGQQLGTVLVDDVKVMTQPVFCN
jgi:hypothetical protein